MSFVSSPIPANTPFRISIGSFVGNLYNLVRSTEGLFTVTNNVLTSYLIAQIGNTIPVNIEIHY